MLLRDRLTLRAAMLNALEGVGDRTVAPIWHDGDLALHVRVAMTAEEQAALSIQPPAACESVGSRVKRTGERE